MKSKTVLAESCRSRIFSPIKESRREQSGFTLLEVLVAVLVLSFGLLGLAGMQLKGLQSAHLSYQRTLATSAAQDAVERLWVKLWKTPDSCPDPVDVTTEWHDAWKGVLVGMDTAGSDITASGCEYLISVLWQDERFSAEGDVSRLVYVARLPQAP
ncbi:type IV pilus modification protein PilV [Halomonas sp. HK25]|uniref:type IV pilus modification protein PilV n=1 Tax=Halomonas sp. HK25 TaxID=3394321 RepID=UPI0039FD3ECE